MATFKGLDLYGKTIGFRVNGQDKARSTCGMWVSICIYLLVFVLFLQKVLLAASSQHLYFVEQTDDFAGRLLRQDQNEALKNFNVGVGILSEEVTKWKNETRASEELVGQARYGTWVLVQEKMELDEDGKYELIQTEIPTKSCSIDDFKQAAPDARDFVDSHIEDLTCFDSESHLWSAL